MIDTAMETTKIDSQICTSMILKNPEPWPEKVNPSELLASLRSAIRRYCVLSDESVVAVCLWILFAHLIDVFRVAPILAVTSPLMRCGKSTLLTVIRYLVPKPLPASNITPATVFRAIEQYSPTLIIDEADTFINVKEELTGILNSGHGKGMAFVLRIVGDDLEPRAFSTWCPKVIARIGKFEGKAEHFAGPLN
jgi:putative DNA primase/helicase